MADAIAPCKTVTFVLAKVPDRTPERKTIQRLMRMQPRIQRGLKKLAQRRRRHDNVRYIRAGTDWVNRTKATKLARLQPGETFTLTITPQIIPDIKSVESYLAVERSA
ncbi:MAG: hypothetical protein ACYSXF_01980 [Planctomycetota bacterium]|jgi:hypothetical protein